MSNVTEEQSTGSVTEVARFRESAGKTGRSFCGERTRVILPTGIRISRLGFDLGQLASSSEADRVLDYVLQWQNLSGIPQGVGR